LILKWDWKNEKKDNEKLRVTHLVVSKCDAMQEMVGRFLSPREKKEREDVEKSKISKCMHSHSQPY
jgi:hypothetical protein